MNNPMFIYTTRGHVNLSLVTRIEDIDDEHITRIFFDKETWLDISIEEGELLADTMRQNGICVLRKLKSVERF